jgi:hypothetical protein
VHGIAPKIKRAIWPSLNDFFSIYSEVHLAIKNGDNIVSMFSRTVSKKGES